ncbi:MAG: EamA family transporter [Candidatus Lokiarchaeota archaeon]|nr:EamA family transporter [Candidatus Lokiarchaeota archaeon]
MENKYIFHIITANILWSFIPILASELFESVSIILIIFLRFFISGIILFLIAIGLIIYNNNFTSNQDISLYNLLRLFNRPNKRFFNIRNIYYLFLLGFFGIIVHIIGYFLALKITSIAFAMIGFQLSIIIIAFYEHGVKLEKLDIFKGLYILILIFCISIIIFVKLGEEDFDLSSLFIGGFYIILFASCTSFLHIGIGRDPYSAQEILLINQNKSYKIIRMLIKIALIFLFGIITLFPFILIMYLIPIEMNLYLEITYFFQDISKIFGILLRWEVIILIFFSTVAPYILIFVANVNWNPYNLTYSQWSSILTVIEPIGAIFFGVLLINESFPIQYLIIIIFLLIISILFRYAHETKSKVNAYILIHRKQGILESLTTTLLKLEGVFSVQSLIGTYDLLLNVKTNSIRDLYSLINENLRRNEGIEDVELLFIDKIYKI